MYITQGPITFPFAHVHTGRKKPTLNPPLMDHTFMYSILFNAPQNTVSGVKIWEGSDKRYSD